MRNKTKYLLLYQFYTKFLRLNLFVMGRSLIKDQISNIKTELTKLLSQIFGIDTNRALLIVNDVFEQSKAKIQKSLDYKETFDPKLNSYIDSLNIPDALKDIDFETALDLVKNDTNDIKNFLPILKPTTNNNFIKSILTSGLPGSGSALTELSQTLSNITGNSQKSPDFVRTFLTSDDRLEIDPNTITQIIDPTFTALDTTTRTFVASAQFIQEPQDILDLISSGVNLPQDLADGLVANKDNPEAFVNAYIQQADLAQLPSEVLTPLLNGSFTQSSPTMLDFISLTMPQLALGVRVVSGTGLLSGLGQDANDFISHTKLSTINTFIRSQIQSVISKIPISIDVTQTVGKMISQSLDISKFVNDALISGSADNLNLSDYGLESFSTTELNNLISSSLDLNKLSRQMNKVNLSQFSNLDVGNLISQGGSNSDLFKLGSLINSGFGNKLGSLTDLIGSGKLGSDIKSLTNNINELKNSFLGLNILGQVASIGEVDNIVKELILAVPIGDQNLQNLLERIGPEINKKTQKTLSEKGDRGNESADLIQRRFARDFRKRGPAARNRPQDDRGTNEQYVPKPVTPETPPISAITDGPIPSVSEGESNNI